MGKILLYLDRMMVGRHMPLNELVDKASAIRFSTFASLARY